MMECRVEWLAATSNDLFENLQVQASLQKLLDSKADISQDDSLKSTLT
jgi:hypothetical protein